MSENEQFQELRTEEEIKQRRQEEAKPPKRRVRKESPPPLRPYGKKPWRTIITVSEPSLSIFKGYNFSPFFYFSQGSSLWEPGSTGPLSIAGKKRCRFSSWERCVRLLH